jgi:hypothetical protein
MLGSVTWDSAIWASVRVPEVSLMQCLQLRGPAVLRHHLTSRHRLFRELARCGRVEPALVNVSHRHTAFSLTV